MPRPFQTRSRAVTVGPPFTRAFQALGPTAHGVVDTHVLRPRKYYRVSRHLSPQRIATFHVYPPIHAIGVRLAGRRAHLMSLLSRAIRRPRLRSCVFAGLTRSVATDFNSAVRGNILNAVLTTPAHSCSTREGNFRMTKWFSALVYPAVYSLMSNRSFRPALVVYLMNPSQRTDARKIGSCHFWDMRIINGGFSTPRVRALPECSSRQ